MARTYTTLEDQTMYDICVQEFGGLDDLDEIIRASPDLNQSLPVGYEMSLSDTEDELPRRFLANNVRIATGLDFDNDRVIGGFEYEFELEFVG